MKNKGRLYMLAAALLWGLAGVCMKSTDWTTMQVLAVRSVLTLTVLFIAKGSFKLRFSKSNILGGALIALTGILYLEAIKLTTAGTAIVLQYVAPIFVFLYAVIFTHRKARVSEALITLAVFLGCLLSFLSDIGGGKMLGNLLGLLSGLTFAAHLIVMTGKKNDSFDSLIIGTLMMFCVSVPFFVTGPMPSFTLKNIFWVSVLGIFQFGLANVCFAKGVKTVDSVEGSLILAIEPVFNPIPVAILCGEMMTPLAIIGAVIVIAGVTANSIINVKRAHEKET